VTAAQVSHDGVALIVELYRPHHSVTAIGMDGQMQWQFACRSVIDKEICRPEYFVAAGSSEHMGLCSDDV
jgi:hypothetical protein